jgi:hypothetical protein
MFLNSETTGMISDRLLGMHGAGGIGGGSGDVTNEGYHSEELVITPDWELEQDEVIFEEGMGV